MKFFVLQSNDPVPRSPAGAYLVTDNWDDWFRYKTMYDLWVVTADERRERIGPVKIGQLGMERTQKRPSLAATFEELASEFFSLGQLDEYYENLQSLGDETRVTVLQRLRDIAYDQALFAQVRDEDVTTQSLMRNVPEFTIVRQFARIARGGTRLRQYDFDYRHFRPDNDVGAVTLSFSVVPESVPPTNVHVLIGRNGVGKTHHLRLITRAALGVLPENPSIELVDRGESEEWPPFGHVVYVSFSAFDEFPVDARLVETTGTPAFTYVGLHRGESTPDASTPPKSIDDLSADFIEAARLCRQPGRLGRWLSGLETLSSDPAFATAEITTLSSTSDGDDDWEGAARRLYKRLSSGHKIVLLALTRLVQVVDERTVVLMDEPEAHLHPPLLAAFVRALTDLLVNRNGVAIISTHSPVVLQEVPRRCVWQLRRRGDSLMAERPERETFGENVSVLTSDVFGLEVVKAGYNALIAKEAQSVDSYEALLQRFNNQLGAEGRALARVVINERSRDGRQS